MAVQAFPEGKSDNERNLIELVRLAADLPAGLVAYSAICTHLGCTVLPSLSEQGYIVCPCHASLFDPAAAAQVVTGPANRPLPALPIEVSSDGVVGPLADSRDRSGRPDGHARSETCQERRDDASQRTTRRS